jgi:uncharacterized protein
MKPAVFRLQHVDIPAFAADARPESGTLDARTLPRVAEALHLADHGDVPVEAHWSARGELRRVRGEIETWMDLQITLEAPLECQRCLETVTLPLQIERAFVFAASEDQAALWDEEREEDVLVSSRNFDLLALIEDEIVLALPLVPRHDTCPRTLRTSVGEEELAASTPEEVKHPFAALAQLRKTPQTASGPTD